MFEKIIALIILAIAGYNIYRVYERGKIREELQQGNRKKITHEEVVEEQKRRDQEKMMESIKKMKEEKQKLNENKTINVEIIEKTSKKEFKPYTADEKKDYADKQKEKREKGALYEAFVAEHYRSLGYEVIEHGKIRGKKDGGIDLIAKNIEEVIMIQCKNWKAGTKYTINHAMISAFVGNVAMFIAKNTEYEKYIIKRVYAISEEILDKSALARINENSEMVMYKHIPF